MKKDPVTMKAKLKHVTNLADLKEKLKLLQPSPKKKLREVVTAPSPVKSGLLDIVKDIKISTVR
jgi:hypothetical protein